MIYLDAASTAKYSSVDDIIVDTITTTMRDNWQNPSSLYASNIKEKISKCRANIAKFIKANPDEIYFTSGASESNNWAIKGFVDYWNKKGLTPYIITTSIEHKSIMSCVNNLSNADFCIVDVDNEGFVDLQQLNTILRYNRSFTFNNIVLVSIQLANNEIGTIQPIKKIAEMSHKYGAILHVDATQAFGHIPIDVKDLGIDLMSASGHKVSPVLRGIGFLYKKNGINIHPLIYGAQENGLRGGTENTYGIIGLNKAIEYCDISKEKIDEICEKRDFFIKLLESKFGCKLNGHKDCRLPNNVNVAFPQNITGESLLYMLDMSGVKVSTGSACNSKSIESSYVLKAIGLNDQDAMKTIRFSLSDDITYKDIYFIIEEIEKAIKIIEA